MIEGILSEAWQEPEKGYSYHVAEAVHTMHATKAAFRLIIKREERRQSDLFRMPLSRTRITPWPAIGQRRRRPPPRCWAGTINAAKQKASIRNEQPAWG